MRQYPDNKSGDILSLYHRLIIMLLYHFLGDFEIFIPLRGLFQNYPENEYNFFNTNSFHLKFYMRIELFISNTCAHFYHYP